MVASSAQKETTGFPARHAGSHRHPDELTTAAVNRSSAHGDDAARGGSHGAGAMALVNASICDFGWKARDFALAGVDGKTYSLADVRGPKGTLVVFICNHCPYVRAVIGRLVEETDALKTIGIGTIAINPNDTESYPEDSFDNMKAFAKKHGFPFPYVIDETQEVARAYRAQCTPDFFGFNTNDELQYRGRLDAGRPGFMPRGRRELLEAMTLVAQSGKGPLEQTPSMGCSIKWRD
jgi:peroxiredoxin